MTPPGASLLVVTGLTVAGGMAAAGHVWSAARPVRDLEPADGRHGRGRPGPGAGRTGIPAVVAPVARLGRAAGGRVPHQLAPHGTPDGPPGGTDLLTGSALLAGAVLWIAVHPVVAVGTVVAAVAGPPLRERRAAARRAAAVVDQLPDVVDLLRLTTLAGLPVSTAVTAIRDRPGGPVGAALHQIARRLDRGAGTTEALTLATTAAPRLGPLVDALVDHDRYGTPLGPALDRVGIESRLQRRRQAEEAARRLPVTLLFPLVFTTLPACGLLTVVPLLVASLSSLQP